MESGIDTAIASVQQRALGVASARLSAIADELAEGPIPVGDVMRRLGRAGLGLVLLGLTLPALVPLPGPVGALTGSIIALVALQVMLGSKRIELPGFVARRRIPAPVVRMIVEKSLPTVGWLESRLAARRWRWLTGRRARILLSVPVFVMAVIIALPIPFGNFAPSIALIAFALGFMARDGLAILVGLGLSLAATLWTGVLFYAGAGIVDWVTNLWS